MQSSSIEAEHAWYVDAEERGMDVATAPNRLQLSYEVWAEIMAGHICLCTILEILTSGLQNASIDMCQSALDAIISEPQNVGNLVTSMSAAFRPKSTGA